VWLQAANEPFTNHLWSTDDTSVGILVNQSNTYWVEAYDENNCISKDSVNVLCHGLPLITLPSDTTITAGTIVTISATGDYSLRFYNDGLAGNDGIEFSTQARTFWDEYTIALAFRILNNSSFENHGGLIGAGEQLQIHFLPDQHAKIKIGNWTGITTHIFKTEEDYILLCIKDAEKTQICINETLDIETQENTSWTQNDTINIGRLSSQQYNTELGHLPSGTQMSIAKIWHHALNSVEMILLWNGMYTYDIETDLWLHPNLSTNKGRVVENTAHTTNAGTLHQNSTWNAGLVHEQTIGYEYLWSTEETTNGILVNQAGTYAVQVANEGNCNTSSSMNVFVQEATPGRLCGRVFYSQGNCQRGTVKLYRKEERNYHFEAFSDIINDEFKFPNLTNLHDTFIIKVLADKDVPQIKDTYYIMSNNWVGASPIVLQSSENLCIEVEIREKGINVKNNKQLSGYVSYFENGAKTGKITKTQNTIREVAQDMEVLLIKLTETPLNPIGSTHSLPFSRWH